MNPHSADNYFNLANVHQHKKEWAEAQRNFNKAIEKEDRNAKYYNGLGLCYQEEAEDIARHPREYWSNEKNKNEEHKKVDLAIHYF